MEGMLSGQKVCHDVFTGGGSVAIHVATRLPDIRIIMNDRDAEIAAFWRTVVSPDYTALVARVRKTRPTVEQYLEVRDRVYEDPTDAAFKVLLKQRCSFSGLGKGVYGGLRQRGREKVDSKWNIQSLVSNLERMHELLKGRTTVVNHDALDYLDEPQKGFVFADPPYFIQGDALYPTTMTMNHHYKLASRLRKQRRWLLTYDDSYVVRAIYSWAAIVKFDASYILRQDRGGRKERKELLISPHSWN
jgi:DNA adenine methylase